jgi:integrase
MKRSRNGLYHRGGVFAFRYKDADGRWKEKHTGESVRSKARKFQDDFLTKLRAGDLPNEKAEQTVERAATRWVDQHAARLGSAKAKRNEKSLLKQLMQRLGTRKLKTLTLDDLKDYQRERREQVRERAINLELRILQNVLKEANLWRTIGEHYKPLREPESDVGQALTVGQLELLEKTAATKEAWQVAYCAEVLAANTGLRGGEIKRLQLGELDLENRRIRIHRKATKTNAGQRLIELNHAATAAVAKLYVRAQSLGATEPTHYLLPADLSRHTAKSDPLKGKRGFDVNLGHASWQTAWRNLREAAANAVRDAAAQENRELTAEERKTVALFKALHFHSMRHSFVTLMAERGVPLPVTMAMVGHMSVAMTKHYTHISNRAAREAVELLDKTERTPFVGNFVGKAQSKTMEVRRLLN